MTLTALPGDPDGLATKAARYESIADTIRSMSIRLADFASDVGTSGGRAVTALAERVDDTADAVAAVQPRYANTASALTSYAVSLRDAKDSANAAITAADADRGPLDRHYRQMDTITYELMPQATTPDEVSELQAEYRTHRIEAERLEGQIASAEQRYHRAVEYRDLAAKTAIAAIQPVLEQMNDTLSDYVDAWVGSLPDFMQLLGRWIGDVFVSVMTTFQSWADAFWAGASYLVTYVGMFLEILGNYPPELWIAALLAPGLALILVPALTSYLANRLALDVAKPTPELTLTREWDAASGSDHYRESMEAAANVDNKGRADSTVIEVIEVLDENGDRVGWRVVLPSTQDWEDGGWIVGKDNTGDLGGLNDLDSNLALMLTPSQQAAYERAVYQAMLEAGVGPDDPVMLTGWSQGGIMAGTLASDPDCTFNIQAIFVSGAPIDAMNIPDSVSVISVQHVGDVVATLDGPVSAGPHSGSNWETIVAEVPIDPKTNAPYEQPHNPDAYTATAGKVDEISTARIDAIKEQQNMFFSENEKHSWFTGVER
jgi:hypothetical protein